MFQGFISLDTSKEVNTSVPALPVTAEFVWDARDDVEDDADESDGSEEDEEEDDTDEEEGEGDDVRGVGRGLQKSKSGIAKDETGDLATKAPTTVSDFERLLLGSPNSSFLWIQYMSFYLGSSEVDKARSIAQRALQTINFREEQEKLNIWVALLNLENSFGTDDSMEETFRKAIQANDDKAVYLRTAEIFDKSGKFEVSTCISVLAGIPDGCFESASVIFRKRKTSSSDSLKNSVTARRLGRCSDSFT